MKKIKQIISVCVIIPMVLSLNVYSIEAKTDEEYLLEIQAVINLINQVYVGSDITKEDLYEGVFDGLNTKLDNYSGIYTQAEVEELLAPLNSEYIGVGIGIQMVDGKFYINDVFEGGDALEKGVAVNDQVIRINGESVQGKELDEVISKIKGPENTAVFMELKRGNETIQVSIERRKMEKSSVERIDLARFNPMIDENFGNKVAAYSISTFAEATDEQIDKIIQEKQGEGVEYLLLDMRDNTGGYLETAINLGRSLIPEGDIITLVDKKTERFVFRSELKEPPFKIVLLINGKSASATEVFAGAVKESGVGVVIGETSYGKGVAQNFYQTGSGKVVKLTAEEFLSRDGNKIQGVGVEPDIYVDMPEYIRPGQVVYLGDQTEQVKKIEDLLYYLGYLEGAPNDVYDEMTVKAVKEFQTASGLNAYGIGDAKTQEALNIVYFNTKRVKDLQMQKAIEWIQEDMK